MIKSINKQPTGGINPPIQRDKDVDDSINMLRNEITSLDENLQKLVEQLTPVLSEPNPSGSEGCDSVSICPLSSEIKNQNNRIYYINKVIVDLLYRLQI
jgi:hypothetical protein